MKTFFTVFLLMVTLGLSAQSYNNEWIDFSKTYYKFKIASNGLYRIPQSVLASASLQNVPAEQFQLFRNGQEVPIYTSVASGPLGTNDYIEFWGRMNDGAPDQVLYRSPTYQHTQKWSLETDTAVYFLTVKTSGAPLHFTNVTNDTTGTVLTVEPYFFHKAGSYFKQGGINPGFAQVVQQYIYSSSYDIGEFWASGFIKPATPLTDGQSNLYAYTGGPDATLSFGMTGCADNSRSVRVTLNGVTMVDTSMDSFYDMITTKPVSISQLSSNSISVQFINNCSNSEDRTVASFYELNYPRQFNFGGQSNFFFELPAKSAGYFLKITNLAISGSNTPVLYDLTEGQRYTAIVGPGSTLSFLLGGSAYTRRLVLVNEDPATVKTVTSLTSRTFTNYASTSNQGNYVIVSSPLLYTGSSGNNPVVDYKNYRSSPAGGSFNAHIYDIDELVDQFAFGIKKHPLSVHNFLRYARATFSVKPEFVLLIGHGMTYPDYNTYSETLKDPLADKLNIIPTFGNPASDNKLSANNVLDGVPETPIGRLSVVSGAEIEIYLNKLKQYEQVQATAPNTIDGRLWMKNVLQLTGVSEPFLGTILCNYMAVYKGLISDSLFGAKVYTLCEGNSGTGNQQSAGLISNLFSGGFSMMNYFGHSSNTVLGYNLDDPKDYDNNGKYPVFFINGCDAGDFFVYNNQRYNGSMTLSELYLLTKDKGSIAFVASTHFGIVNYLNLLLYGLYQLIDQQDFGKPLGIIQKDALQQLVSTAPGDYFALLHAEEMTTHGDPYLRLNQASMPDYDIEASQVVVSPSFISVSNTTFNLNARFYNLGKSVSDSVGIKVQRQFPDGTVTVLMNKKIKGLIYSDSIQLSIPISGLKDKGMNKIIITINPDNSIPEVTYSNNSTTAEVFIYQEGITPVYPYNYAIINDPRSKLTASTANPLAPLTQYVMEIDTTQLFNSALKVSKSTSSIGGVLDFDPGIVYMDSVVYYWRVAPVPANSTDQYKWSIASFTYIDPAKSSPGFNQSHYFQHLGSTIDSMQLDASRQWKFNPTTNNLYLRNAMYGYSGATADQEWSVAVNENPYIMSACLGQSLAFNVFDPVTMQPWKNVDNNGNNLYLSGSAAANCGSGNRRNWNFEFSYMTPASRNLIMRFMDSIPDGFVVAIRSFDYDATTFNSYAKTWRSDTTLFGHDKSLYHSLLNAGFLEIDSINKIREWVMVYKKNDNATLTPQYKFSESTERITLSVDIPGLQHSGNVVSPVFGPAKKWSYLHWRGHDLTSPVTDTVGVQVIGIDTLGNHVVLYNVPRGTQDLDISALADAKLYPNIQLKLNTSDSVKAKPYQLDYWRLNYTPVPEGALAPNIFLKSTDTVQLGQPLLFSIAFKNVSPYAFDSMRIKMFILDKSNVSHPVQLSRRKPLVSGDTLTLSYTIDTKAYPGANRLYINFNPDNDQPEQYLFNNFLYKDFYVVGDNRNPLLDVTFDNVHILNDDIVSAKPHIQVKLKSPSQYNLLTDTSLIKVQLKFPDGSIRTYHFNSDTVRFTPASSSSNNEATVDFMPQFLTQYNASGDDYELIVTGKDELGNTAGTAPYRVSFKIITKPMISNMLNYPNPFTTSTAFVFTITGSDVPQNIKIQILTITGKIVREITKDELGPLHVGRNITEFKWNGTDMYGQRLANGVYLYHVVTNLNGKSLDKYKAAGDNTDKFFNNGYGKMYLMR
jgi:hypothetical protein